MATRKKRTPAQRKALIGKAKKSVEKNLPKIRAHAYGKHGTKADQARADQLTGIGRAQGVDIPVKGRVAEGRVMGYAAKHSTRSRKSR